MSFAIAGARGSFEDSESVLRSAAAWARDHGAEVTLLDARSVFGRDHLESAARHGIRARDTKTMSTRSVAMETLRYAAGQRQVADAIRVAGLQKNTTEIGIVLFGSASLDDFLRAMRWSRADDVLSSEGKSLAAFGISKEAAATVSKGQRADLALEKVALVDVDK